MNKIRVVIAMSGGVDSSVAAALLKEKGYEVIGITMCFNLPDSSGRRPLCCGSQGIEDARRVAHKLNIRHYVLNMQKDLAEHVIKDFCQEYIKGRTPNPCVRCNQYLKFDILLKKSLALGAKFLATGHYAKVIKAGRYYRLKKASDLFKDQSYFLYRLNQKQLKHILFPLAGYTKRRVRKLAKRFNLPVADKLASQEICFLADADYRAFLKSRLPAAITPGLITDKQGNILGRHRGIAFYTIGQRQGLGIAKGYPLYITGIDPKNNQITVGNKEDAKKREFLVKETHFISRPIKKKVAVKVRIRYNHKEVPAELSPVKNRMMVKFRKAEFAVTPGQSAVFYDRDVVLGGGIIDRVLD
jgi:tRNA-specific 2-thiouridylase